MGLPRRIGWVLGLLLLPAPARPASAGEVPPVEALRVVDVPNDDGSAFGLVWRLPESARVTFSVWVSREADPHETRVARFRSDDDARRKAAYPEFFGPWSAGRDDYFVLIKPFEVFLPLTAAGEQKRETPTERERRLQELRDARYRVRLIVESEAAGPAHLVAAASGLPALAAAAGPLAALATSATAARVVELEAFARGTARWTSELLPARGEANYFKWNKLNNLIVVVLITGLLLYFLARARRNPNLFVRPIPGLQALDEALGRATEMGRPVYFIHGLGFAYDIGTIAAITILGRVSRRVADFDTQLRVTSFDPLVLSMSREVVREAYVQSGRPDAFREDILTYPASEQFPYVAAVCGMMLREKPAANIMMGRFYAESLILAEVGATTGAIQIAGTDAYTQLPFFVVASDYTLLGEELFAASAYLSRDPIQLSALKMIDTMKVILGGVVLVGVVALVFGWKLIPDLLQALP
jgi:hypothetical protein